MNFLSKLLVRLGLRFQDPDEEARFYKETFVSNKSTIQAYFLAGGIIYYVFFIWDQIIDPIGAVKTQMIRGLIGTPIIWACGTLFFFKSLERYYERIAIAALTLAAIGLAIVFSILKNGFDYGAVGTVLTILFGVGAFPARTTAFSAFCLMAWRGFDICEMISQNASPGMFLINNLSIGTATFLGVSSAIWREYAARQQFVSKNALSAADARVDELLGSLSAVSRRSRFKITISYRRSDTDAIAGRIRDRLVRHFGDNSIFMDIDSIPFGVDFRSFIHQQLKQTNFLLLIIGPDWAGMRPGQALRIRDISDPVRVEIEAALQYGIPIIPMLVSGATIPEPSELPDTLRSIPFLNAAIIDSGRDFHQHMDRLMRSIMRELDLGREAHNAALKAA